MGFMELPNNCLCAYPHISNPTCLCKDDLGGQHLVEPLCCRHAEPPLHDCSCLHSDVCIAAMRIGADRCAERLAGKF